jgi:3-deoxy-D-manno-octulosonic-acid transferase
VLKGRFGGRWADRFGCTLCGGGKPLWAHGASVGEAKSAIAVLSCLRELGDDSPFVLSVGTPLGLKYASENLPTKTQLMAPPLDFFGSPSRALDRVAPKALVVIETEIWPELINQCRLRGIAVMVVSGRLSAKSLKGYQKIRFFMKPVLSSLSLLAVISDLDKERFLALGADPSKVVVLGSPKFDGLINQACVALSGRDGSNQDLPSKTQTQAQGQDQDQDQAQVPVQAQDGRAIAFPAQKISGSTSENAFETALGKAPQKDGEKAGEQDREETKEATLGKTREEKNSSDRFSHAAETPIIVAGSTHPDEEELILSAVKRMAPLKPNLLLAPRHLTRIDQVMALVQGLGFEARLFSQQESKVSKALAKGDLFKNELSKSELAKNERSKSEPAENVLSKNELSKNELADNEFIRDELFKDAQVVILDRMGILGSLYRIADVALVGGSLLKGAGHNPLEPAACGKPIIFGPYMSSFDNEAKALIECGGAVQVDDAKTLAASLTRFITDKTAADSAGASSLGFLASLKPVAPILARAVLETLGAHERSRHPL